jgi:hypothetical protein
MNGHPTPCDQIWPPYRLSSKTQSLMLKLLKVQNQHPKENNKTKLNNQPTNHQQQQQQPKTIDEKYTVL